MIIFVGSDPALENNQGVKSNQGVKANQGVENTVFTSFRA
jgi:hypothetical protein